jgi:hypothetical protein
MRLLVELDSFDAEIFDDVDGFFLKKSVEIGDNPIILDVEAQAVIATSLMDEILAIVQYYCDRTDSENVFDELKNKWVWGGFTTQSSIFS